MIFSDVHLQLAADIIEACRTAGLKIATAESCTGGLIAACLTEIPGSSAVIDRGFVVYSNRAKQELLGVPVDMLEEHGAVSAETATAMASGARDRAGVDLAIAVTGIAGPDGGSAAKPVGLVHLALVTGGHIEAVREVFSGDRQAVRAATLEQALRMIDSAIK
ncbi:MAG: CinA family protein [Alphaproteobacteria bacterium]|nr:CinA family protein [Alphaproteobacteria bacterium]